MNKTAMASPHTHGFSVANATIHRSPTSSRGRQWSSCPWTSFRGRSSSTTAAWCASRRRSPCCSWCSGSPSALRWHATASPPVYCCRCCSCTMRLGPRCVAAGLVGGAVCVLAPHAARPDLPLRHTGLPCGSRDLFTVAVV
jgi:hypothetical protein